MAGFQLLTEEHGSLDARRTVEDQLSQISESLGFSFLILSDTSGHALARSQAGDGEAGIHPLPGFYVSPSGALYWVASTMMLQGNEEVGTLVAGEEFRLNSLPTPAMLVQGGRLLAVSAPLHTQQFAASVKACAPGAECELKVDGHTYFSLPLLGTAKGATYFEVRSLQDLDQAATPALQMLTPLFWEGTALTTVLSLVIAGVSARSIVRPLAALAHRLHLSTDAGTLIELPVQEEGTMELRQLAADFNRAAAAIQHERQDLVALVEVTGSLAQALDARDPYTAGHSRRVSDYAVAIGRVLRLPDETLEILRVGSLLHDIGKIGVPDGVLSKPGKLLPHEQALVRAHPVIGRRILDGIAGLAKFLPVVELHHENWDGSGYPHGLKGEETPLVARIVKVADAYDAMTSDRPYRAGMSHEKALAILQAVAGAQTDPAVVRAFEQVHNVGNTSTAPVGLDSLLNLEQSVRGTGSAATEKLEQTPTAGALT
jgi:hypothetical protein